MSIRLQSIRVKKGWMTVTLLAVLAVIGGSFYSKRSDKTPDAVATLTAGPLSPSINGTVTFKNVAEGTLVTVDIDGLPPYDPGPPPVGPHGFHLHENPDCEVGDVADPFLAAGGHWNPHARPHGDHAGDFPVLFSNGGSSRMTFVTNRFSADDVIGLAVVIHENPDDYRTQPAGDSGSRLACGVVSRETETIAIH